MSKLFIVPTPIGNLADVTFRSIAVLKDADIILCEDTRTSGKFLKHYEIKKPLYAYHQHNEHRVVDTLIERIKSGEKMACITDAGTPAISDPAFLLVRACADNDIEVETLPGATAFVPALVNSALPCDKFVFEGFLPHKKGRQTRLKFLAEETRTIVFYESPHRLLKTLKQLLEFFEEERLASVSRELTKLHEETVRGNFSELIHYYENNTLKGEIVLVVEGRKTK
ncbi:MAG: 16S rRNA (cytidine(1402)-2'-O)-methyltransferase [Flavobacteriales bacterium]|nr:16S rRNA (cytidine(1402)-2'-O)-methyltransferase [Flavobacteriales bacterium]